MQSSERLVDEPLERLSSVSETKRHSKKPNGALFMSEIVYVRYGITVRDGTTVQCPVVSTRVPVSRCLLWDHVEWGWGMPSY